MKRKTVEELVISDTHIGNPYLRRKSVQNLLRIFRRYRFKKLIIVGDLCEGEPVNIWQRALILALIRIKKKHGVEIIIVKGNHDCSENEISRTLGVAPVDSYEVKRNGKRILFIHGHQFDDYHSAFEDKTSDRLICNLIAFMLMIEVFGLKIGKAIVRTFKHFVALAAMRKIRKFARENPHDAIIIGHLHVDFEEIINTGDGRLVYHVNLGHWMYDASEAFYITIDKCATVRLARTA